MPIRVVYMFLRVCTITVGVLPPLCLTFKGLGLGLVGFWIDRGFSV